MQRLTLVSPLSQQLFWLLPATLAADAANPPRAKRLTGGGSDPGGVSKAPALKSVAEGGAASPGGGGGRDRLGIAGGLNSAGNSLELMPEGVSVSVSAAPAGGSAESTTWVSTMPAPAPAALQ